LQQASTGISVEKIKEADKISNMRDLLENPPRNWNNKRKRNYLEWAEQVADGLREVNKKLEDAFDELVSAGKGKFGGRQL